MPDVVLVTGVSRYMGGRFARLLSAAPGIGRVIGVDLVPPRHDLGGAEFIRADIRNPVISRVIERAAVDTVVHMNVIATPTSAGGRVSMKEINVIGTMQLLAACQKAASVRRVVVKSTAEVYGASGRDPAVFSEDMGAKILPRSGWGKDSVEVESYVRGFSRRRPDVSVVMLRLANVVGPGIRTAMTDYFSLPVVPTVLGYDARMHFVHEDDALEAMRLAVMSEVVGAVNVAGEGVVMLSQAARLAGRPAMPVPGPMAGRLAQAVRRAGWADVSSDKMRYFTYGRGLDLTRMRHELGLAPRFTSLAAFEDFAAHRAPAGLLSRHAIASLERELTPWAQVAASAGTALAAPLLRAAPTLRGGGESQRGPHQVAEETRHG